MSFLRAGAVAVGMAVNKDGLRAKLGSGAERHGGVHAEFSRFVGGSRNYAAFVPLASDNDWLAFERRIKKLFDGDKESVHVHVEDGSGKCGHIVPS
jgi:hypothetical protein